MTDMPPSRFRVVERGRRLEVIDTRAVKSEATISGKPEPTKSPAKPLAPVKGAGLDQWASKKLSEKMGAKTPGTWTTSRLYDAKAPRTFVLGEQGMQTMIFVAAGLIVAIVLAIIFPPLFAVPLALANPKIRGFVRRWATEQIDRFEARP